MTKLDLLRKGFVFQNFTADELDRMGPLVFERSIPSGESIFEEGSPATSMFVIKSGGVDIVKESNDGHLVTIAQLNVGDHFGEMAFVDRGSRAAGAKARKDLEVFEIKYD